MRMNGAKSTLSAFYQQVAPPDEAARMEKLREEYKEVAAAVNALGYNGDMLDVVPREVEEAEIPSDEEAQIGEE